MLDLSFGLPIVIRDAALKMVAPGPNSEINREYYAQEHEKEIEEGRGAVEAYSQTDEKARDLLRRLAQSEPYYKKQRRLEEEEGEASSSSQKLLESAPSSSSYNQSGARPVRTSASRPRGALAAKAMSTRPARAVNPADILPPSDPNVTSLFVTGVEDDLHQHVIQTHFEQYGQLRSVVCSHRSHCAFLNYMTRAGAEAAADACQGRAVVKGVPLRVQWGKPKKLDSLDPDTRMAHARAGREAHAGGGRPKGALPGTKSQGKLEGKKTEDLDKLLIAPPPGSEGEVQYASLAGE